jgi:hypothetical protein
MLLSLSPRKTRVAMLVGFCFLLCDSGRILCASDASPSELLLARDNKTEYGIVLPKAPSASQVFAATELQGYLRRISGAFFPIYPHDAKRVNRRILLVDAGDDVKHVGNYDLGSEGFSIETIGPDIRITGSNRRGIVYGVYTFLEEVLGCRWYSPGCEVIPRQSTIKIGPLAITQVPDFIYREPWYMVARDVDWAVKNKVNGIGPALDSVRGGRFEFVPGYYCHTFDRIMPAEKYLATNPEYFSLVDGKRVGGQYKGQLCLTHLDVTSFFIREVRKLIKKYPGMNILSVSQNDNRKYCQCENCARVDAEEGSPAGLMVRFANAIAADIGKDYPEVFIHTFAYQYTEKPPRITKPHPRVVLMLCPINCCQFHRYDECSHNAAFMDNLKQWSALTNQLYIWHYNSNLRHYLAPYPDLRQLTHSLQLYHRHHVKGMMAQGMEPGGRGFMDELKAYMIAKLLWDASLDPDRLKQEFLQGYFGNAAEPMHRFLELLHDKVEEDNIHGFYSEGIDVIDESHRLNKAQTPHFLTEEIIAESRHLFKIARASVTDSAILKRLERTEFSLDYVETMRAVYRAKEGGAVAKGNAIKAIRLLAERSRDLGYLEWSLGPRGTLERRLTKIESELTE